MNSEKLYFSARDYFNDLLNDIAQSKHSIELEMYILAPDSVGDSVFEALKQASNRGVKVRVLLDAIGSLAWLTAQRESLAGVKIRAFHPFSWTTFFRHFRVLNRRTHRKVLLVDGAVAYVGSFNFMKEAHEWHEAGVRITGPGAILLQNLFEDTWEFAQRALPRLLSLRSLRLRRALLSNSVIRANQFYRARKFYRNDLIRRIRTAKDRVWLMTPYFLPPTMLLRALLRMGPKIDVRIIVPGHSDIFYFPWLTKLYYRALLLANVKVYEFKPTILHAKVELIDDWAIVGSSNLNHRSFYHDLETDIVIRDAGNIAIIEQRYLEDIKSCRQVVLADREHANWITFIFAKIIFLARNWL